MTTKINKTYDCFKQLNKWSSLIFMIQPYSRSHVWYCQAQDHNKLRQHLSTVRSHDHTHAPKGLLWAHQLNNSNPHQVDKHNQQIGTCQEQIGQLTQSSIIRYSSQSAGRQGAVKVLFTCERCLTWYSSSFTTLVKAMLLMPVWHLCSAQMV